MAEAARLPRRCRALDEHIKSMARNPAGAISTAGQQKAAKRSTPSKNP